MSSTFMRFQKGAAVMFVDIDEIAAITGPTDDIPETRIYGRDYRVVAVSDLHPDEIMRDMAKIVKEEP